jgi:hypothetical protein
MVDPSKPIDEVFKYADIYFEEQTFNFNVDEIFNNSSKNIFYE